MKDKDLLGQKLREIMEEDSRDINISSQLMDEILSHRKKTWKDSIYDFLNREIEVPIAPAIIGIIALFIVTTIPKDIFKKQDMRIIDIGGSHMIIREGKEVGYNSEN